MQDQTTLSSIPNEILVDIFDLLCEPTTKQHITLSQVCRQFRAFILSLSQYWTYVSNTQTEEWSKLQIERSGERGLTICYYERKDRTTHNQEEACRFVQTIAKHCHRWSELTYSINYANTVTHELFGLELQCLRKLVLRTFHVHNNDVIQLLETWTMPALQIVSCSGSLLTTVLNTKPPLESIDARHITGSGARVLRQCLHHPNARGLQQLSISMYLNSAGALENGSEPIALLELSCLQSLNVDVQFDSTILVNNFLKHVSMPRLTVFAVRFTSVACYGDGCAFIRALQIWIGCSRLENLRILDISVRPNVERSSTSYSGMFKNILNHLGKSWVMLSKPEQDNYSFGQENLRISSSVPDVRFVLKPKTDIMETTVQAL